MHQPCRHQSFGFSNNAKTKAPRKKPAKTIEDHAQKEQQVFALINQGKLQDAEVICNQLISIDSKKHISYCSLAAIYGMQGKLDKCIALLKKALEINPNLPESHFNLGNALKDKGELTEAIDEYKTALRHRPQYPEAHLNIGNALKKQGDISAAIASFQRALQLKPNYPEAYYNLGNAFRMQNDLCAAVSSFNKALQLNPNLIDACNNLGCVLQEQGRLDDAINTYKNLLKLRPNHPEAHNNLGNILKEKGNLDAAIASYNSALKLNPKYQKAHYNLGIALQEAGDIDAAIITYKDALQLNPNDPDANWNLSQSMLLGGDYRNGWRKHEWRTKTNQKYSRPHAIPNCEQWRCNVDLNQAKQLLLVTEQGLGDTLQFMRYATILREKGISISFCAQPKLHSLIQASGIDPSPLTPEQANRVTEGRWIPLLSVPKHLEVRPDNPVITKPYLKTTDELHTRWAEILSAEQHPVIGINWQGNPKIEKTGLRGRSLALDAFAPLTSGRQISLLSLQKGFGSEQLDTCSFNERFVSCQDQVNETWDFLETAAIIANCDLVITSDTSVAHLAGGMGKTTWLLLHKVPDWRWGLEGDRSFWYPSMRLFRQKQRGNWNEVMERVTEALQEHFGSN